MSLSSSSAISALQEKISASEATITALEAETKEYAARLKSAPKEKEQSWMELLIAKSNEMAASKIDLAARMNLLNTLLQQQPNTGPGKYPL